MLDIILKKHGIKFSVTVKGAVSVLLVVLAVALPQITHAIGGTAAASVWMPMFAPALISGCILGWRWGLGVGIMSPVASFAFSSLALGSAMPTASRLPYYILELAVYGVIGGLFSKKIQNNPLFAFPAVILAQVSGRAVYVIYNLIAGRTFSALMSSVQTGLTGLYLQAVLVPVIIIVLYLVIKSCEKSDKTQ